MSCWFTSIQLFTFKLKAICVRFFILPKLIAHNSVKYSFYTLKVKGCPFKNESCNLKIEKSINPTPRCKLVVDEIFHNNLLISWQFDVGTYILIEANWFFILMLDPVHMHAVCEHYTEIYAFMVAFYILHAYTLHHNELTTLGKLHFKMLYTQALCMQPLPQVSVKFHEIIVDFLVSSFYDSYIISIKLL